MLNFGHDYPFMLMYQQNGIVINSESRFSPFYYEKTLIELKQEIEKTLEIYKQNGINEEKIDELNRIENEKSKAKFEELYGLNIPYKKRRNQRLSEKNGFIYLMVDNRNGYIKIGYSKNPKKREKTLQSEVPDITMIFAKNNCSIMDERKLHDLFKDFRIRGEWFKLNKNDINKIKAYLTDGTSL